MDKSFTDTSCGRTARVPSVLYDEGSNWGRSEDLAVKGVGNGEQGVVVVVKQSSHRRASGRRRSFSEDEARVSHGLLNTEWSPTRRHRQRSS